MEVSDQLQELVALVSTQMIFGQVHPMLYFRYANADPEIHKAAIYKK